tara:strand:- start:409 stop:1425 length:1017 start_codon:yes stop_codon:yes gene_type:complete
MKECPPEIYYNQLDDEGNKLFPGVKFVKRIVMNRDKVSYKIDEQIREEDAGEDRVKKLIPSYRQRGFIYSKPPQAIMIDPSDPKRYSGLAGFGRHEAQDILGITHMMYDILEFDKPLYKEAFKVNSNDTDDHVPATLNTKTTIIKSVVNAVTAGIVEDDDDAILQYLSLICRSRPDWHSTILSTIRKEHIARFDTMKAWNTSSAKKYAKKNDLPYEGNGNKNVAGLGYVRKWTSAKNVFWDSMIMSYKYGFKKVGLITWVDEPNPATLEGDRQKIRSEFSKMEGIFQLWIANYLDMGIDEVRKRGKGRFPMEFTGFLPQDTSPNTDNGGEPIENTIVK